MDRREFIKGVGLGIAAGSMGFASPPDAKPSGSTSRVAVVTDAAVRAAQGLDAKRVAGLLDRALLAALDASDSNSVWRDRLRLGEADVVGIKLNCLAGVPLAPTRELVDALLASLQKAGVSPGRLVLFERGERDLRKGGFEVQPRGGGPYYLGNDSEGAGYEKEPEVSGQVGSCLSRILTRRITVMINVGVLKDHSLAGIGCAMKNLYGLIHNPNKYHDNHCDPYVADVLAFPAVQRTLRLNILDALTAQCQGGPGYSPSHAWPFNGLVISADAVALDRVAWDLIEERRKLQGLQRLAQEKRAPTWLNAAAKRGLGNDELGKIQIVRGG